MLRKASADKLDKTRYKPLGVESLKEKISVSYKLFFENTKQKKREKKPTAYGYELIVVEEICIYIYIFIENCEAKTNKVIQK